MTKDFKIAAPILAAVVIVVLVWRFVFPSPDYDHRRAFILIAQVEWKNGNLAELFRQWKDQHIYEVCKCGAEPTRTKDIVVYNPTVLHGNGASWVVVVKVKDLHSAEGGHLVLWSDGSVSTRADVQDIIEDAEGLECYYLRL